MALASAAILAVVAWFVVFSATLPAKAGHTDNLPPSVRPGPRRATGYPPAWGPMELDVEAVEVRRLPR